MRCQGQGRLKSIGTDIIPIMDTLAMGILTNMQGAKDTAMSDNEFLQTSWHYDKESKMDVAKVVFIFDGIATISPDASPDEHKERMSKAVNAARDQVSDVAATFGSLAHTRALRYLMWLADKEITTCNESARVAYKEARNKFTNTVMEVL